ncbi:alpha-L-rhamnosidase C-terminal domain-containing protein [Sphingobium sp. H39-3-25]|uniref:alpha-L-rhamnosidase-related protein n=1 Tax=Sphingobium arseniciresistens TaxID=3030834 RepID=UPI0023BA352B|nr:alpha-L-rhamnosidase C-terminal domain-containing protein [Sphingobium arseniciresistens]
MIVPTVRSALALLFLSAAPLSAQDLTHWITAAATTEADAAKEPIALQFRHELPLSRRPARMQVRISADHRFIMFVNGKRVAQGPARGDLQHWRYETIDLAPYLRTGTNVIAASVWSDGKYAPLAQLSGGRTAFYIQAVDPAQQALIEGPKGWQVRVDRSRTVSAGMPHMISQIGPTFYAAGGPETITASAQAGDWSAARSTVADWQPAIALADRPAPLSLVPDTLPQMTYRRVSSGKVVRATGIAAAAFPDRPVTVPANSEATILVDAGRMVSAYPALLVSGGAGAQVTLSYAEALYDPAKTVKDNRGRPKPIRFADRARVADGKLLGLTDRLLPDGGANRRLAPFWWRTWRFVELRIKTAAQPLILDGLETYETGYPFERKGRFVSSDLQLNAIWDIGWKTALIDAHETYMDTAYWEQLQYIGDSRIQMLLSYDVAGDNRLAVQALDAFDHSRIVEGLPQSAWPETNKNVIPPFALLWINSLHDFWMRQTDADLLRRTLPGTRSVIDWYKDNLDPNGIVQEKSGWPFVDWIGHLDGWDVRGGKGPPNCVISMLYYGALRDGADLERAVGDPARASAYIERSAAVRRSLDSQCWDVGRGLYADTPAKTQFSQHAAILAVLYDLVPADQQKAMLDKVTLPEGGLAAPQGILASTYYFSFYLARALDHAGLSDRYIAMLKSWRAMLAQNFTAFPEMPDPSRSDTHAWSAHPTTGLLTYVAGIQPDAPGFSKVAIRPHLGDLTSLDAAMAHPQGLIETRYAYKRGRLTAIVTLPGTLAGIFEWNGRRHDLRPGVNRIEIGATDR